jgi:hypothetical protein
LYRTDENNTQGRKIKRRNKNQREKKESGEETGSEWRSASAGFLSFADSRPLTQEALFDDEPCERSPSIVKRRLLKEQKKGRGEAVLLYALAKKKQKGMKTKLKSYAVRFGLGFEANN